MDELCFDDQVVAVTGAGRGMGRSHALLLARRGAAIVVNDLGGDVAGSGADARVADEVVAEIVAAGGRAVASTEDVATETGGRAVVELALERFGRLDALVHNAGIIFNRPFTDPFEQVRRVLDVHLASAWHLGRPAWEAMTSKGYGRIVLTSSTAVYGMPRQSAYSAAKAGLIGLTRALQAEADGGALDIRVNAVLPMAKTRMSSAQAADRWRGLNEPEEVSAVVGYLASRECRLGGEAIVAGATHVARLALAQSPGWAKKRVGLTIEDVAEHLEEILNLSGSTYPTSTLAYIEDVYDLVLGSS